VATDWKEVVSRKYAGVPFSVWAAVVVVGTLGYTYWKNRQTAATAAANPANAAPTGDTAATGQPIFLAQQPPVQSTTGAVLTGTGQPQTNEDWRRQAVEWLIQHRNLTADHAQAVVDGYLSGGNLSFQDGQLRDAVISQFGIPPELPSPVGTTGPELSAPTGFVVSDVTRSGFHLAWQPVQGATAYEILYPNGHTSRVTMPAGGFFGIRANTPYTVKVRARSATGAVSGWSSYTVRTAK